MPPFRPLHPALLLALTVAGFAATGRAAASDWPSWAMAAGGDLKGLESGTPGLRLDWKAPLGSGYSGIAVAGGRAVTLFSDGESDVVAAFDVATGAEIWRAPIDPTYRGHDGSDDGPLASPVIADGTVYGIGPRGRLFARRLTDGGEVWSTRMEEAFGARAPHFGFVTTPLVEGDLLIVMAGGAGGRAVMGLDRRTGAARWSYGDDAIQHQSPLALNLAGRRQVVLAAEKRILGLDPAGGQLLWALDHGHPETAGKAVAIPLDGDRFLVDFWDEVVVYQVERTGDDLLAVQEAFRTRDLRASYSPPAYHDGHLYGFSGGFLTCVNATTGERVWRSRQPGGRGLVLAGGRLVILATEGAVVVADASPEGYREISRVAATGRESLTKPSLRDGRIFVRDLKEIAAVSITGAPAAPAVAEAPWRGSGEFDAFVRRAEAADVPGPLVEKFLEKHPRSPVVEDGRIAHFLYQGPVQDLAIIGDMVDEGRAQPMHRVAGTDLYYRSFPVDPDARWQYRFQVDFEKWVADPRNPERAPYPWDEVGYSVLEMPDQPAAEHLKEPAGERGRLEEMAFESASLGNSRTVQVWVPAGYEGGSGQHPLLVVTDGPRWIELARMTDTLDNLSGRTVRPPVVAFVPEAPEEPWLELGGSRSAEFGTMLVKELLPALASRYRLEDAPGSRAVMGAGWAGVSALLAVVSHPEAFGAGAVQSADLSADAASLLLERLRARPERPQRFYVDWGRYDERNPAREVDLREDGRRLTAALRAAGHPVSGGVAPDGTGWGSWRNRTDRVLETLFPLR